MKKVNAIVKTLVKKIRKLRALPRTVLMLVLAWFIEGGFLWAIQTVGRLATTHVGWLFIVTLVWVATAVYNDYYKAACRVISRRVTSFQKKVATVPEEKFVPRAAPATVFDFSEIEDEISSGFSTEDVDELEPEFAD